MTINVSRRGALLGEIHRPLRPGGKITLARLHKKEQFRIAWVGQKGTTQEGHVGILPVNRNSSFWNDVLEKMPAPEKTIANAVESGSWA